MVSIEGSDRPKVDLVLEGGGVKGIGLVGAVLSLDAKGYVFPRVAGTSAGAIVASLIAAHQVAGKPLSRLEQVMRKVDYSRFKDEGRWERHAGAAGEVAELLLHMGVAKGDYLVEWLGNELAELGVHTFADLMIDDADDPGRRYPLSSATGSWCTPATSAAARSCACPGTAGTTARSSPPCGSSMRYAPA